LSNPKYFLISVIKLFFKFRYFILPVVEFSGHFHLFEFRPFIELFELFVEVEYFTLLVLFDEGDVVDLFGFSLLLLFERLETFGECLELLLEGFQLCSFLFELRFELLGALGEIFLVELESGFGFVEEGYFVVFLVDELFEGPLLLVDFLAVLELQL
jgi:hypothetical protein